MTKDLFYLASSTTDGDNDGDVMLFYICIRRPTF